MLQEALKRTPLPAGGQVYKASTGDYQVSGGPLFVATVAWEFKNCPRCHGDLFKDDGALVCLQCGFRRELCGATQGGSKEKALVLDGQPGPDGHSLRGWSPTGYTSRIARLSAISKILP